MGGKKQGSARTPHEAPDSLKSAQRLRAIGLISLGPIKGPVNKWKSTYFDNTPIQNENGIDDNDEASFNFKNTEVSFTLGTQDQSPLQGFEMSEREVSVSTEVKYTTPITRTVTDPDVTRLRVTLGVNALYEQNDQGDTNGTSVWFRILINGLPRATYEINGKSSSRFYRSYIIDNLPERPFTITVERTTTDSKSQRLQNATNWVSYTEIIDTKLSYPNMALVGIKTDSRYNPNFPNVNFLLYGRLVKVPSTYEPETRTYSTALWKGDWKQAWTNNPAWVFYDLVTDPLAGLGKRVGDYGLDKFQLYQIAKYCDELVDDGYGGKEPRMTANLWLTDQRSAYDVLSDMASVFRSIAVWNGTQFTAIQDRTTDPVCTYSQANVIDGKFSRQYAAMKSIYTAAEVEYADERNMYQKAVEYVADDLMIERYGYNVRKMTAYATTSRGQAHRWGKWVLATSLLEQCTITFSVGRQGLLHLPGDIIEVADNDYAGKTLGGRVVAVNGKVVTLDQPIEISGNSYLSYLNDEMKVVKVAISSVDSKNKAVVTLATVPTGLEPMDDWVLKTPTVSTQLYRAIGITENDDGSYTITALQHEPQKESIVDGSASFIPVVTTAHTGGAQKVANAEASINENGVKLTWETPSSNSIVKYEVRLYRNGVLYQTYLDLETTELTFDDLPDGSYVAEIRSKNANGQLSDPVTRAFEINLTINRLTTKSLYFSIQLDWDLPKTATVGNYTEIWRSVDNNISNAKKIAALPYPQNSYILNGIDLNESYYFFVRCGDKAGNKGQFTEGVFGEADHNPDTLLNVLEGQITRSQLGSDLIASLQQDIDTAVAGEAGLRQSAVANAVSQIMAESQARAKAIQDEANNRTKAIQSESVNLTKRIQAEATARGAAVTQLQNVDAQQAQLISAVTAKANNALSGLEEERTARANGDKAEAQAREALTARMGAAESNIVTIQRTVANNAQSISEVSQNLNAKIDNINIGGRNLLRDSEFNAYNKWGSPQIEFAENANRRTIKVTSTGTNGPVGICSVNRHCTSYFQQGETYTLSFFARGNRPLDYLYLMRQDGNNVRLPVINVASETEFNYYKLTFKAPFTTQQGYVLIGFRQTSTEQFVEFHSVKLEKGNVATDWTPAPEDVDSAVSAVSADLTSYKQTQAATDSAQAQQLNQLSVNLTKAETNFNAKITEEKKARVDADKANAERLTDITSRVANAESNITNFQSTKANKSEVASLAQSSLQAVWKADTQSAIGELAVGGRNLLLKSNATNLINFVRSSQDVLDNTDFKTPVVRINCIQDS
ncbi:phage tail protein, partial [Mannheimia haemolytica]|nr:phage tail protein [Mannheimia haemolytica]